MSSVDISSAASVTPPRAGKVYARTSAVVAELIQLPEDIEGARWITLQADGEDIYVLFGDSSVVASITDRSSLSADVPQDDVNVCIVIPAGQERSFDLRKRRTLTHFSHISPTANGAVRFWRSSGE